MWYRFNADRFAAKNGKLLISKNNRHFLINGLTDFAIDTLINTFQTNSPINKKDIPVSVHQSLIDNQILIVTNSNNEPALSGQRKFKTDYFFVVANSLRYLGNVFALISMAIISIILYCFYLPKIKIIVISELIICASFLQICLTFITIFFTFLVHELGHAVASCYYTGTVGKINFRFIWGMPAIVIDVSSYCLTHKIGKVAISLAGIIFQIFTCVCLIALFDIEWLRIGAKIGIVIALLNLLPLPQYDGYWVLVDLFERNFKPRLIHAQNYIDMIYGAFLLLLLLISAPFSIQVMWTQSLFGLEMIKVENIRGWFLFSFTLFASASYVVFIFTLFKTLFPLTIFKKHHENHII